MVRTEVDVIVNQLNLHRNNHRHDNLHHINHFHIIHRQSILYNILNLMNFSAKKNCAILSINTMILKMIMKMKDSLWKAEDVR